MVINFHTHAFPDKIATQTITLLSQKSGAVPHTDGTVSGLFEHLQKCNADIAVALPVLTSPKQFESVNRFAMGKTGSCLPPTALGVTLAKNSPVCALMG